MKIIEPLFDVFESDKCKIDHENQYLIPRNIFGKIGFFLFHLLSRVLFTRPELDNQCRRIYAFKQVQSIPLLTIYIDSIFE